MPSIAAARPPVPGVNRTQGEGQRELSILLWNTWLLPGPLSDNNTYARASEIPSHIYSHDIILLNEAFTHKKMIISALRDTHPYVATLPKRCFFWPIFDSGLVVLSKYAILEVRRTWFKKRSRWDIFAAKGAIGVRVDLSRKYHPERPTRGGNVGRYRDEIGSPTAIINYDDDYDSDTDSDEGYDDDDSASSRYTDERVDPGYQQEYQRLPPKTIDIYNTHMQAGNSKSEHKARAAQSIQLGQFIAQNSFRASSVVLGGDLNMGPILESVHYSNDEDARQRVAQYGQLREESGLEDVKVLAEGKGGDINRYLKRGVRVSGVEYPPVPLVSKSSRGKGSRLSDSDIVILKVKV